MNKQTITSALGILVLLFTITLASATVDLTFNVYESTLQDDGSRIVGSTASNFDVVAYECTNPSCTTNTGSAVFSANNVNSPTVIQLPNNPTSTEVGYNVYFYKNDWIAFEASLSYTSTSNIAATFPYDNYLARAESGNATINSLILSASTVNVSDSVLITANVQSALEDISESTIPSEFLADEDVETNIVLEVLDSSNNVVYLELESVMIDYSSNNDVFFTYTPLVNGTYTIRITTDVSSEDKILSSISRTSTETLIVLDNTPSTPAIIPTITIVNPDSATDYLNTSINLDVIANQAITTWLYSLNGAANVSFAPNTTITAVNGTNALVVYGTNANGTGMDTVNFTLNLSGPTANGTLPILNVLSPVNGTTYTNNIIDVNVSSDQIIDSWRYSLNNGSNVTFTPNTTMIFPNGNHTLRIYGTNANGTGFVLANFIVNVSGMNFTTTPNVTIINPISTTYTTTNIPLNVVSDQPVNWYYSLNGGSNISFNPNTTIVGVNGANNLVVYGIGSNGTGSDSVSFIINLGDDDDDDDDDDDYDDDDYDDYDDESNVGSRSGFYGMFGSSNETNPMNILGFSDSNTDLDGSWIWWLLIILLIILIIAAIIWIFYILK